MPEGTSTILAKPSHSLSVATGPLPGSQKIYVSDPDYPGLRVAMREIALSPSAGEEPLIVYDTSGP